MARSPTIKPRRALPAADRHVVVPTETAKSDATAAAAGPAFVALARLLGRAAAREFLDGNQAAGSHHDMEKSNEQ